MSSPFSNAIAAGLVTRRSLAGVTVSYDDQDSAATAVTAVRGQPNVGQADALAARMDTEYVDWMIAAAALSSLDMPPKPGHTITASGDTYTVTSFEGLPCWSWVDPGESEYRIHTVKTGDS